MESDNSENGPKQKRSIFDDPVDLFNFHQIQSIQSPSLSYAKMIQASRSVPGSRRNSNDDHNLDALLGAKLSLNDSESGFRKLPFAMTPHDPIGAFSQKQRTLETLPNESEVPSFNPHLSQGNDPPMRNFSNTVPVTATGNTSEDYSELFPMTNINNLPPNSNVPINGLPHSIVTPEMSAPWIPYHTPQQVDVGQMVSPIMQNDIDNNARRYSYGWHNTNTRLTTSQSTSDLAQMNSAHGIYPAMIDHHRGLPQVMCPQFQQFGFCSRNDMCQFSPSPTPFFSSSATDSLYQQYNNQQHQPLPQKPTPFFLIPTNNPPPKSKKQNERRSTNTDQDRFADAKIDDFIGKLYELCKDQNGCRFLQKKIEEKENGIKNLEIVFNEIYPHFTELMTDSFGNYLCQKMLERCNNEQRTIIVDTVAPELVKIALNMHGTRAVQKLIEYLSTEQQIKTVTSALNSNVVTLIKDLNGNHVIQKCLHRLSAENNQFIYDAVCANCIEVASHKHGCCVLQRCFDHATISQKDQLVDEIARHALPLVKNPFGNYVVQYVLELGVTKYSESVIRRFVNHVCTLSVQKFSSNVIENCIRTAEPPTRRLLIAELVNQSVMEKLLHDSFANYVVQTSLDFSDEDQRAELVECIRPLLPTIRSTPYGKRIHSKIFRDTNKSGTCNKPQSTQQQRQRHRQSHDTENLDEETLDQ